MTDTQMTDVNDDEMTEIEVITADETTHEFELGEAPLGASVKGCAVLRGLGRTLGHVVLMCDC